MALISTKQAVIAGVSLAVTQSVIGGDEFINSDERVLLIIRAAAAVTPTITLTPAAPPDQLAFAAITFNIPGVGWYAFGPFPARWFNNTSGRIPVAYSSITNVFISVLRI